MSDDISNRAREAIALAENWAQNSSKVQVLLIENGLEMSRALLSRDAEVARLREALGTARDDLDEALGYVPEYFREKWKMGDGLARIDAALRDGEANP